MPSQELVIAPIQRDCRQERTSRVRNCRLLVDCHHVLQIRQLSKDCSIHEVFVRRTELGNQSAQVLGIVKQTRASKKDQLDNTVPKSNVRRLHQMRVQTNLAQFVAALFRNMLGNRIVVKELRVFAVRGTVLQGKIAFAKLNGFPAQTVALKILAEKVQGRRIERGNGKFVLRGIEKVEHAGKGAGRIGIQLDLARVCL